MNNAELSAFANPGSDQGPGSSGLTKREYFAAMTLQSVISNPAIVFHGGKQDSMFTDEITMSGLVSYSIKYADELIKQLEDGKNL